MSDLENLSYFIGIEFYKSSRGLTMDQRRYVCEILKRFEMQYCNPTSPLVEAELQYRKTHMKMIWIQRSTKDSFDHSDTFVT